MFLITIKMHSNFLQLPFNDAVGRLQNFGHQLKVIFGTFILNAVFDFK